MADFTKTTKTEKILILVLTLTLMGGLVYLFVNDKGFITSKKSDTPQSQQLIEPITP